jgi:hypothetical protein
VPPTHTNSHRETYPERHIHIHRETQTYTERQIAYTDRHRETQTDTDTDRQRHTATDRQKTQKDKRHRQTEDTDRHRQTKTDTDLEDLKVVACRLAVLVPKLCLAPGPFFERGVRLAALQEGRRIGCWHVAPIDLKEKEVLQVHLRFGLLAVSGLVRFRRPLYRARIELGLGLGLGLGLLPRHPTHFALCGGWRWRMESEVFGGLKRTTVGGMGGLWVVLCRCVRDEE